MDKAPTFVGIDVSKHRLDVHLRPSGEHFTASHDEAGVAALVERLAALAPTLIALEATGGLEVRLAAALAAAGLPVAVVNPARTVGGKYRPEPHASERVRERLRGSVPIRAIGPGCTVTKGRIRYRWTWPQAELVSGWQRLTNIAGIIY